MTLNECMHCDEPLEFKSGRGWVHKEGGAYKMTCARCGWTAAPYPSPGKCPQCGATRELRDDHCALPKRS